MRTTRAIAPEPTLKDWSKHKAAQLGSVLMRLGRTQIDDSLGIFMYHRIAPLVPGVHPPTMNVTPERFREQILGLQRRGYVVRPLSEVLRLERLGQPMPPRTVVLTFDDGFGSVYKYAWPILKELRAPATLFLCTAFLDSDFPFPFDRWAIEFLRQIPVDSWRALRSDECREMLASGLVEVGAHSHTHEDFRARPRDLADDLRTCQSILREKFGVAEPSFAFPFGYFDDELIEVVRQAGLTSGLTVDDRLIRGHSDPIGWGRLTAYDWDTPATLAAKREGWQRRLLSPYRGCKRIVRQLAWRNSGENLVQTFKPSVLRTKDTSPAMTNLDADHVPSP